MRLSIGAGVGPLRVSQTIARSGRRSHGNPLGDLITATIGLVFYVVFQIVRVGLIATGAVVVWIVGEIVAARARANIELEPAQPQDVLQTVTVDAP